MKITYERLNQIIEEEVVKFKNLNEATLTLDEFDKEMDRIRNLATKDSSQAVLNRITLALKAIK